MATVVELEPATVVAMAMVEVEVEPETVVAMATVELESATVEVEPAVDGGRE